MSFGYNTACESKRNTNSIAQTDDILGSALSRPANKCVKFSLDASHPLEFSEKNHFASKHQMNMNMLRNVQGIHAPLRISMELRAFRNVGRLPFMSSSKLSSDIISGRDDTIDFADILYPEDLHEQMNQPYAIMENYK